MGRFFQTSTPTFIDNKMFQLPYELMGKVLEKKDEAIQEDIDTTVSLSDSLDAKGLKIDEGRLKEKIGGYQNRIDEQVQAIKNNALGYDTTGIQKLKRDITTDWTTGEVAAIQSNRASHLADLETWKELAKKSPELYSQEYLDTLASASLKGYGGINYKGPSDYGVYKGMSATAMPDMNTWVEERLKGAMPDVEKIEREHTTGGWRIKTGTETKVMSDDALRKILMDSFNADTNLQQALSQRANLKMAGFTDILDEKGNMVSPFYQEKDPTTGQMGIYAQNNTLGNAFQAGIEKFGFTETKKTVDSKADPFKVQEHAAALKRTEEKKKDEFLTLSSTGTVTAFGGDSSLAFKDERTTARTRLAEIEHQGMTLALTQYNFKTEEEFKKAMPETYLKVVAGDMKGAGITSDVATTLTAESKRLKLEESIRANILAVYREKNPMPDPTDTKAVIEDNKKFSLYLAGREKPVVPIQKGWGYFPDFTVAKQNQFISQLKESNRLESAVLSIPPKTIVKNKNNMSIDISKYGTINEMIEKGIARVKEIPTGAVSETEQQYRITDSGLKIPIGTTTKIVELMDGTVIGNLELTPESLVPVFGASDDGKVQLEATFNLAGKRIPAIVKGVGSTSMDAFNDNPRNTTMYAGKKLIAKVGSGSVDLLGDGSMVYHGAQKGQQLKGGISEDGTKTFVPGTVVVTEKDKDGKVIGIQTYDMSDPIVEEEIYKRIFE